MVIESNLLDEWVQNIRNDGFDIESGFSIDDTTIITLKPSQRLADMFVVRYKALNYFADLMPENLIKVIKENGFIVNGGTMTFHLSEEQREVVIGYTVIIEKENK